MRNFYLKNKSDRRKQQEQIDNILAIYAYLGKQNRKKPLPKNDKTSERIDKLRGGEA